MSDHGSADRIPGVFHSGCGAAEGGAVYVALDAGDGFLIVRADGSWGRGGANGWTQQKDASNADFSVQVCADGGFGCEAATEAHFVIESGDEKALLGSISYRTSTAAKDFQFRAMRSDRRGGMRLCG